MNIAISIVCAAFAVGPTLWSAAAEAQDLSQFFEGYGPKTIYEAPNGRYRAQIPGGLTLQIDEENPDPNMVVFAGDMHGTHTQLLIKRVDVTPGAASSQLMLTTRDNHLAKLPNFTVEQTLKTRIAGRTCTVVLGRYDFQGNKAYPMAIEQAYVIDGSDGFVLGMEVPYASSNEMVERMKQFYASFVPIAPKPEAAAAPTAVKKAGK